VAEGRGGSVAPQLPQNQPKPARKLQTVSSPSSLYLHVPFCARRCPYCDFAVSLQRRPEFRANYVEALRKEISAQLRNENARIETVFCGGGTPTELSAPQLNSLLQSVREHAEVAPDAEISLEANPENLSRDTLCELRSGGWNRLSLGAQAFDSPTLRFLGRAHDATKIEEVVRWARATGWTNFSLDLIFGAPNQTLALWRDTLCRATELGAPHVSAYSLTVEGGTALGARAAKGLFSSLDDELMADRMDAASEILESAGLERYEVSNWARPGFECRHNQNYWRGGDYFAAGCGAHGHRDGWRWWNERDAKVYLRRLDEANHARAGEERLDEKERLVERIATGLRTREGVRLTGEEERRLRPVVEPFERAELLGLENGRVFPLSKGFALADGLAARLIGHIV